MTTYSTYDPTSLFAGEGPYRSRPITVAQSGAVTPHGTLLGRSAMATGAGAATSVATVGNTGNGTLTPDATAPVQPHSKAGPYAVKFTAATTYDVYDPDGRKLSSGTNGVAYTDQIKFVTAAGGTAFVAGDSFTVTVAAADIYRPCIATATDGSQIPAAIVASDIDTTTASVVGPAYFDGTFTYEEMIVDASWSYTTLRAAFRQNNTQLDVRSAGNLG